MKKCTHDRKKHLIISRVKNAEGIWVYAACMCGEEVHGYTPAGSQFAKEPYYSGPEVRPELFKYPAYPFKFTN